MPNYSGVWTLQEQYEARVADIWDRGPTLYEFYAWGQNALAYGNSSTVAVNSPILISSEKGGFEKIFGGYNWTHGIKANGTLWAWGTNSAGQLGQNNTIDTSSPVQIGSDTDWLASSKTPGSSNIALVKTTGELYALGNDRLSNVASYNTSSPVQIGALTNWTSEVDSGYNGYALIKSDGTMWTSGSDDRGRLGQNTTNIAKSSPTQVGSDTDWYKVTKGQRFGVAIKTNGTMWMWGAGEYNGDGNSNRVNRSSPVQIGSDTDWSYVHSGNEHVLAIKTNGTLWGWGRNAGGELGDGTTVARSSMVQIGALTNWSKVNTSRFASTGIKTDGTIWSWGNDFANSNGLAGEGVTDASSPVQLGTDTDWYDVNGQYQVFISKEQA